MWTEPGSGRGSAGSGSGPVGADVNNVHRTGGSRRRIFIPSVVLSVGVVVFVKHRQRQSCSTVGLNQMDSMFS